MSQNAEFELSKTTFGYIFKFLKVKKLPGVEKKVKDFKKKKENLNKGEKWNKKMGGRSCFITLGAFGHGLLITRNI